MTVLTRRGWLALLAAATIAAGCATPTAPTTDATPPIVFVHGNGDTAALWTTTMWRFESQGWPRDRLVAVDLPNPLARDDDTVAQPGRSSAIDNARALAAAVDRTLARTGAREVVLVGNSRGGNAIRLYVQELGGASRVSKAVLGGTPNHGVWNIPTFRPNNEFNGAGPVLTKLNAPKGPDGAEVVAGVDWMTLRSDGNDKFAQPDGAWIGAKGTPTNVTADGPALKGARNVVLPGRDHREVSYHAEAFAQTYAFVAGKQPDGTAIVAESNPVLDGTVTGYGAAGQTNLPLAGATVEAWAVDPKTGERRGDALLRRTVGADGRWGPLKTTPTTAIEFVVAAPGSPTTHVYRSPFPRSSDIVNFRPERVAEADRDAAALVVLTRPRGYFGVPRDRIALDGRSPPAGIPSGVAGVSSAKLKLPSAAARPVAAEFASGAIDERIVGRVWPLADGHVTVLELTH